VLYEADGETRAGESARSSDEKNAEALVVPPAEAKIPDATNYLLRIYGKDEKAENFYLLSLKPLPPQSDDGKQQQQQDPKDQQQQQQKQEKQERPDRSTLEKEMEKLDRNKRNLEAERARQKARHLPKPLKDW
jgi:hypothetical protein